MKALIAAGVFSVGLLTFYAQSPPPVAMMPPLDRSKLPAAARNVPLERLSSGALMLLNRDDNLVRPPAAPSTSAAASAAQTSAIALDSRVGPNTRLGNDPSQLPANMRAQAEPFIARSLGNDAILVATFQEGRFASDGGAVDCGYSASTNGGLTWSRALIPQLTQTSGGPYFRATDPVVAFDLSNDVYISTLDATDAQFANGVLAVSKWRPGISAFAAPVVVYRPPDNSVFPDKDWMAINTYPGTGAPNRIVVTWTLFNNSASEDAGAPIVLSYSDDGGATWSPVHYVTPVGSSTQGSQPVFLPNGNLVVVYWNFGTNASPGERLEAVISTDGGVTFGPAHRIAAAIEWNEPNIRTGSFLPSAAVDRKSGNIFVVYQAVLGGSPRIAFAKSLDGGNTWSAPAAISNNPAGKGVFNPAINVADDGKTLTAVFYDHRNNPSSNTLVDMYMALSNNGGVTWQPNIRLTDVSTDASLAPLTSEGYMLGDYLGVAQPMKSTIPAVPVWVDTRTGNPDPFVTRASAVFTYYVLANPSNNQTALWYFRESAFASSASGPTLPPGWTVSASADFNSDGQPDYALFNSGNLQTGVWYLNNSALVAGAYAPTLPAGWNLVAATDFNGDTKPEFLLSQPSAHRTAIWYLNGATFAGSTYGPMPPAGWSLVAGADFNGDRKSEFVLWNASSGQTAIWYLNGGILSSGVYGPTLPAGWALQGAADFNGDGKPDFVLLNESTRQTAIWFLNGARYIGGIYGPTIPADFTLVFP